jgi:hypothetical protein
MAEASIQSTEAVQRLQHQLDEATASRDALSADVDRARSELAVKVSEVAAAESAARLLEFDVQAAKTETVKCANPPSHMYPLRYCVCFFLHG